MPYYLTSVYEFAMLNIIKHKIDNHRIQLSMYHVKLLGIDIEESILDKSMVTRTRELEVFCSQICVELNEFSFYDRKKRRAI